jgi:nucleoside 2-deoxyribosyltransferase
MPIRECVASLARHLEAYKLGLTDEDHMAAIRTNAGFILHFEEEIKAGRLPATLDDMPKYAGREQRAKDFAEKVLLAKAQADLDAFNRNDVSISASKTVVVHQDEDFITLPAARITERPMQPVRQFTVYLCGTITGQEVDYLWRQAATSYLWKEGIRTLDPLRGKKPEDVSNQGLSYMGQLAAPEIAERDRMDIQEADAVLAHFPYTPPRQSIGSLMEMGAAAIGFKKPVILCTELAGFNDHLFCRNFCTQEPNFEQALRRLVALSHVHQEKR